ncbi:hypothetical protein BH24ACI3_BH24ACI3_15820 [soil metagenome]
MGANPKDKVTIKENDGSRRPDDLSRHEPAEKRSYYYDDAHGYEVFDPEAPDDDDDESEEEGTSLPSDRC